MKQLSINQTTDSTNRPTISILSPTYQDGIFILGPEIALLNRHSSVGLIFIYQFINHYRLKRELNDQKT